MTAHRPALQNTRKKITISYVIRDEVERLNRSGVNALQLDPLQNRLYSAGRDSIIRIWSTKNSSDPYYQSMEHHTDWVNDLVLCCSGRTLITASSDTTVKVWNAHKAFCMSTLRTHKDYVQALAYAQDREQVASAGLDKSIFLWDVATLTALTAANNTVTTSTLNGSKNSIYSLAMNATGTVIVSGSTEKLLRVWDPRTCQKLMKLKGHTDMVKTIVLSRDGTHCLSGGSDGTLRLWSLGMQRCIATHRIHQEGVWSLDANDNLSCVVSGGRDKQVWLFDPRNIDTRTLVCQESAPIRKVLASPDFSSVWVSTTDSHINNWPLKTQTYAAMSGDFDSEGIRPCNTSPSFHISGGTSIRKYSILNDKQHILTEDSEKNVDLWNVLSARKVRSLGKVDMDEEVKKRFKMTYVPNWFTIDLKIGLLMIHLEESDCFAAWVSAKEADLSVNKEAPDTKLNFGGLLLQSLLEHWPKCHEQRSAEVAEDWHVNGVDSMEIDKSAVINQYFTVPGHTPIIISESGTKTLLRFLCRDSGGETEDMLIGDLLPSWITEIVVDKTLPKFNKIPFYLQPFSSVNKNPKKDRLSASDMLQVRKVIEHVYEKILNASNDDGSPTSSPQSNSYIKTEIDGDVTSLAEERVELLCNEELLDPSMDLRTVKHFLWKQSSDLMLCYRTIK